MTKYISNITDDRRKKRGKIGLTSKEIRERARKRLEKYRQISKDEPPNLVSGDMDKMLHGEDDHEHQTPQT